MKKWRSFYGEKILRGKFKIIRVIPNPDQPTYYETEQLLELLVSRELGLREVHQRWRASWKIEDGQTRLSTMRELSRDYVDLRGKTRAYADKTSAVLPHLDELAVPSLTCGANYWMHRLENSLSPDFFCESGVSVADVNGDGREDVYLAQLGGIPNQLFISQSDGTFQESGLASGLALFENTTCSLFIDMDNDGDQDVALGTSAGLAIMQNNGKGVFQLFSLLQSAPFVFGLCAADYNQDGRIDIYASQYYAHGAAVEDRKARGSFPTPYPIYDANNGGRNILLENRGDLQFGDVTKACGLDTSNSRFTYASMWEDWDNDGDQDLYVVNDFGRNTYYCNDGGTFREASDEAGLITKAFGMGVTSGDYDGDGWFDIHVSNMFSSAGSRITRQSAFKPDAKHDVKSIFQLLARGNSLMRNRAGHFSDESEASGITVGRWSWGCLSPDLNNDGYQDLLVANGFVTGKEPDDL